MAKFEWVTESGWGKFPEKKVMSFSEDYKGFLSEVKTERETVRFFASAAKKKGFRTFDSKPSPGKKYLFTFGEKALCLLVIGKKKELRLAAAHADTPRIDLKPRPLVEEEDLSLLKGHYYGGIKKYQWVNHPLALHGVIFKKDGKKIEVTLGEKKGDPILIIPDVAPHLAKKQMEKKMSEGVEGESLTVIAGNIPSKAKEKKFKDNILSLLNKKYGITEEDLTSSELQLVPSGSALDLGIDSSMVVGYGQDDRASCYAITQALFDTKGTPENTIAVFLFDREEIGSAGFGGANTNILENTFSKVYGLEKARDLLESSKMISADVEEAYNPMYKEVYDSSNALHLGRGVSVSKYNGHGGKYGASEAPAEYFAWIRKILSKNNINWQTGEMGKVDEGGGGTISFFLAKTGAEVIDIGIPVLSLHSPAEASSKIDLYNLFLAMKAFFTEK